MAATPLSDERTPLPTTASRRRTWRERLWSTLSSQTATTLFGAVCVALLLSTQLFSQIFVWEDFPIELVVEAWGRLFRNRLVVALCIAVAIVVARSRDEASTFVVTARVALAIVIGATTGEFILLYFGLESSVGGMAALVPRVARWCMMAVSVAVIFLLRTRAVNARTDMHEATLTAARVRRQAVEARLQLLRAQIEPHFLFNTLATIRQLHRSEPEGGAAMLSNLIDYLKAALPKNRREDANIRDELELVRAYLGLVEVRMSGRLTTSISVDPSVEDHPFPPLSLSTLVENAIKHGIIPSAGGGHVSVSVRKVAGFIEASVVDSGVGLSGDASGTGIGLVNTLARLRSLHGPEASLSLMHHVPRGVRATIRIPA